MRQLRMLMTLVMVFTAVVLSITGRDVMAKNQQESTANERDFKITVGLQGGLGLAGQLAMGGRLFLLSDTPFMLNDQHALGVGLGISFLIGEQNIFVPSLVNINKVSGVTTFTEILVRLNLMPIALQGALGMAIVRREGRSKRGLPVQFATQGIYVGGDARYALNNNLSLFIGMRWAFMDHAILSITGLREIVPLDPQPAVFMGGAWEF